MPQDQAVIVEPEETLGHYADWLELSAQRLRDINGLPYGREIQVGQQLHLVFTKVSPSEFHRRRLEFHKGIQDDFFSHYQIDTVRVYRIRQGDNIWQLCHRSFEIPLWLLRRQNPGVNNARLFPGDLINVPSIQPRSGDTATVNTLE